MATEVTKALERRIEAAADLTKMGQLAAEVGHALALGYLDGDEASRLCRAAEEKRAADEPFAAGFWKAMAGVLGAVGSALQDLEERGALQHDVESRPKWRAVLLALHERPSAPTQLVRLFEPTLTRDDGRVSRQLAEMLEAGLIEAAPAGTDGRVRARQLTARGHRIAMAIKRSATRSEATPGGEVWTASPVEVADAVVAMVRLVQTSQDVQLRELAACAGGREGFARAVAETGEVHGLVDVRADGRVAWGRDEPLARWRKLLKACSKKRLRSAFSVIPEGFLLCVDREMVDDFRSAFDAGKVKAKDVCAPLPASKMIADFSATVFIDPTLARRIAPKTAEPRTIFLARPRGSRDIEVTAADEV